MGGGALWAVPVIVVTAIVSGVLLRLFPVTPVSPLPPTGDPVGFAAVVAGRRDRRAVRRGDPVPGVRHDGLGRGLGYRRGLLSAALFFAFAHVLTVSGANAGDAFGLAVVGFGSRIPVALALGWLFLRRGSVWASFGLHAAFNGILLVLGERWRASRSRRDEPR